MDSGRSEIRGPCPDPGLLAGFAEGRLLEAERGPLESHLALCEECRSGIAAFVLESVAAEAPARTRKRLLRRVAWIAIPAAAAAALFAVVPWGPSGTAYRENDQSTLVAAALDLERARPDLFAGFRPLGPEEWNEMPHAPKRGGALGLRVPCGLVLDARPAFRWEEVPGVARWRVTLLTADGKRVWTADADKPGLDYPVAERPLEPGKRYLYEVAGEGPLGPERARRAFDVASEREAAAAAEARKEIAARAPRDAAALLEAQWLLRAGFAAEAEAPARRAFDPASNSHFAFETLRLVLETLGQFEEAENLHFGVRVQVR